jgi:mannose-1-phosphate guanylyltransferase
MKPRHPATGFGYLHRGERLGEGVYRLKRFCEKPDEAQARAFLASGEYFWNSGMFVWRCDAILGAIARHLPGHTRGLTEIGRAWNTPQFPEVLRREYAKFERISIDYGVMEEADNAVMVESGFEWDDVGSWAAVASRRGTDDRTRHVALDAPGTFALSSDPDHVIATIGLRDMIVVHTPDATLICPKDRAEDVKKMVDELKRKGLEQYL